MLILLIALLPFSCSLDAQVERHENVFLHFNTPHEGLFATCSALVQLLVYYETGYCSGLQVDFERNGMYYDAIHGENWWEYYWEPICLGNKKQAQMLPCSNWLVHEIYPAIEKFLTLPMILDIIKKHIRVKPHIMKKIDYFAGRHFKGFHIIGVHYRGTDRVTEESRVPYAVAVSKIQDYIEAQKLEDYRIFVATDEQAFLDVMKETFTKKILAIAASRSVDGNCIHIKSKTPYEQGEEAMLDCLLLSRASVLFRCGSWLSTWSSAFNPAMPVIMLHGKSRGDREMFRN